jgi:hypothetical protein
MRKLFPLTVIALLSIGILSAQTTTKSGKKRWGHFGFKSGVNFSSFRLEGIDTKSANASGRTGFVIGVFDRIPLNDRFDIQPEFLYSAQGGEISTGVGDRSLYKLNYFSMPILLKYNFFDGVKLIVGPELDFIIKAKRVSGGVIFNETDYINATSVGITMGAEKWFGKYIVLQGRYIYGINDVNKNSQTFQYVNKAVHVSLGFLIQ